MPGDLDRRRICGCSRLPVRPPVGFRMQAAHPRTGFLRLLLTDDALELAEAAFAPLLTGERCQAGEQLVQEHAERVDVGAGVDVEPRHLGLFGRHVLRRADQLVVPRVQRLLGQLGVGRLGDAEVDDLGHRHAVVQRDRTLDGLMSRWMTPFWWACWIAWQTLVKSSSRETVEVLLVAVVRDRNAADQLHHEERPPALGRAGVEHVGDVGVVHHRQRLPLGLEAGDHLPRVHAQLDDLERHLALDRLALLGRVDHPEAALADLLEQLDPLRPGTRRAAPAASRELLRAVHPVWHRCRGACFQLSGGSLLEIPCENHVGGAASPTYSSSCGVSSKSFTSLSIAFSIARQSAVFSA